MGKLRVLIVDDSKISRVMIAENLRDPDFEVCGMAADAVEALRLYTDDYAAAHAKHAEMGIICYENAEMGIYFVEDPDGYWVEVLPKNM